MGPQVNKFELTLNMSGGGVPSDLVLTNGITGSGNG